MFFVQKKIAILTKTHLVFSTLCPYRFIKGVVCCTRETHSPVGSLLVAGHLKRNPRVRHTLNTCELWFTHILNMCYMEMFPGPPVQ